MNRVGLNRARKGLWPPLIRRLLVFFGSYGAIGLILLGILDSSFLFVPVGNDILLVILVARNHGGYPLYVIAAAVGSTLGVLLLDAVCRKGGEEGLKRMLKPSRREYLREKIDKRAPAAIVLACVSPPPFPFTAVIAAASAFQYPRRRLLSIVLGARALRFALVGLSAIYFGRGILRSPDRTSSSGS